MTDNSSNPAERSLSRIALSWLLFPLALFPLVALLTYDWRCISSLHSPPMPSTNWIGALGDGFAYCGYMIFGLAIWIVPVLSVVAGLCLICGRRMRPGRRELWFFLFLLFRRINGREHGIRIYEFHLFLFAHRYQHF